MVTQYQQLFVFVQSITNYYIHHFLFNFKPWKIISVSCLSKSFFFPNTYSLFRPSIRPPLLPFHSTYLNTFLRVEYPQIIDINWWYFLHCQTSRVEESYINQWVFGWVRNTFLQSECIEVFGEYTSVEPAFNLIVNLIFTSFSSIRFCRICRSSLLLLTDLTYLPGAFKSHHFYCCSKTRRKGDALVFRHFSIGAGWHHSCRRAQTESLVSYDFVF